MKILNFKLASVLSAGLLFAQISPASAKLLDLPETLEDLHKYYDRGGYESDYTRVINEAIAYLKIQAPNTEHPAIVMDVDETILSNWPAIEANQFAYFKNAPCDNLPEGPCGYDAWSEKGIDKAFPAAKTFFNEAKKLNIPIFLITGKEEKHRAALVRNLKAEGLSGYKQLYMRPNGDKRSAMNYKEPVRASIEKNGYTIIENLGDQTSDIVGPYSGRGFLLPNPFYHVK